MSHPAERPFATSDVLTRRMEMGEFALPDGRKHQDRHALERVAPLFHALLAEIRQSKVRTLPHPTTLGSVSKFHLVPGSVGEVLDWHFRQIRACSPI